MIKNSTPQFPIANLLLSYLKIDGHYANYLKRTKNFLTQYRQKRILLSLSFGVYLFERHKKYLKT